MSQQPCGDRRVEHTGYHRQNYLIDGCETTVFRAGTGAPLVYLHGGGTWHGLAFAEGWSDHFEVILPYHPGFGSSGDNPRISSMANYVEHYAKLFDAMGLNSVNLVGFSFGGRLAAEFAAGHGDRVEKLVLVAPAGLDVPEHPQPDFMTIAPEDIVGYLVNDLKTLLPYLPTGPDEEFDAMRMREGGTVGKMLRGGHLVNPQMPALLERINVPVQLIWGQQDRIVPPGQAPFWQRLLPGSDLHVFDDAGHLVLDESADARRAIVKFLK
ncbi:Pimeloyl-ACP methyl ester carboxylesterase [Pseudomonas sp. NFACC23-1]|uniref:alpha/beta fold hydrolase n=1 Tax=unclassified Pseudomonas TaxID=196821 RepID=UPI00087F1C58|nr:MULTISPECIES: alpha/beta hydrolase [unclassified Pseudomonas]SDB50771.1 Pimeloyl-ACP methyl ester carboxylesterase [Pseudomonas sp. NFACC17-2]SEI92605.1 Pimeloyl-ACP methyl ester carboxylesterase [Pseudomonas sp. NFACC23-1]SFW85105.1 Pimeloyl-ACP methyl ester carboxylesterase [Pseudomonas sp. NFACC16-2]